MAAFTAFHDHLLPELPGCTVAMVNLHLLHTARDFCETTSAWRVAVDPVATEADVALYDISEPELGSEIVRVTRLAINSTLLWDDTWNPDTPGDVPKYDRSEPPFSLSNDGTELTLIDDEIPSAAVADGFAITAALRPKFTATVLPDFLKTEHLEAMRTGTLARLMVMGKKPWTAREQAQKYLSDFTVLKGRAAFNAQVGNTKKRLRVRKWG